MEFSQRDMAILISMPLAIIMLNFAFSGIGLAEDSVSSNEIPSYNIPQDRFNLFNEFPQYPGNPGSGTLYWYHNDDNIPKEYTRKIDNDMRVQVTNATRYPEYRMANITMWAIYNNGTEELAAQDYLNDNTTDPQKWETLEPKIIYENGIQVNYSVTFIIDSYRKDLGDKEAIVVNYQVEKSQNGGEGWLENIPIIGSVVDTADDLAKGLFWIGSIISWVAKTVFNVIIAMVLTVYDSIVFGIELINWVLSSYTNIVTNAKGFASIFVLLPGLLLSLELLKVGFIIVHLLPTT